MSAFDDYLAAPAQSQAQSFDAYVGAPAAATPNPATAPAPQAAAQPGMLASLGAGLGHGLASTVLGVQQAIGHIVPGAIGNWLTNDANQGLARLNAQYAPYEAANPISAGAGNIGGQIAGTAPAMMIGPEYAGLGLAGRLGLGAAQGAAGAAMMPTSDQNFWTNKAEQVGLGGLLGGATPLATAGAGALGRGLWGAVQPLVQPTQFVGRGLAGAMEPAEAAQAAANIRGAQQFVPGSQPTAAQVAQTPVMVQTEKAAANMPAFKTAMAQRAVDNNDARWQALMGVAGTPADLTAAQTAREAAATPLYQQAHQATANVGPAFMRYAQIPEMQEAMRRANGIASLDAAVGRGIAPVWPQQGGSQAINGAALDYTSRALGDMIGEAQRAGSTTRAGALTALKNNVDNWTTRYVPGVQQARDAYAAGSIPVNTMEVGQQIANGLGTRAMNAGGVPEIGLMPFRSALTSAMNGGNAARYGIDAGALNTLQGIGQDLQRATVSNSIKSPGSDTAYNLAANGWLARQLYGPTFGGAGNVGKAIGAIGATALGHPMAGLGILGAGNRIGQMVGGRLQDRLTGLLMDPNAILPYLDTRAAAPAQAVPNALVRGLLNYARPAAVTGTTGLLYGP
jgi:hypothetical protein